MGSDADESTDIAAIRYCFRFFNFSSVFISQCSESEWGRKTWKNLIFLTPCKNRGGLVERSVGIIHATLRF